MSTLILIFASALLVAISATPVARWAALKFGIIDQPTARKVHTAPVPRFGGIAMYGAVVVALLLFRERFRVNQLVSILLGATWVSFLGMWDDRWGLRPILKFGGQIVAAVILIITGVQVMFLPFEFLNWVVTIVWVVGLTNAINFLDNMDGLSGGIAAIASAFFLLMAVQNGQYLVGGLSAAVLGASVGFLVYNFNPANIFMGDTGSLFLGFMLAALGIKLRFPGNTDTITWMVPVIVLGVPVFDTTLVVFSRIRRGLHPVTPGKDHTSHRLVRMGFTQREAVMALYLVGGMLGMVAVFVTQADLVEAYLFGGTVFLAAVYGIWRLEKVPLDGATSSELPADA
jgi:UDP-GlcNAc:undecaprenyl-phosphate GlcNAc-1-phosphate transferase